ncbi:protein phosphatase [Silvibacterium bohemicum]|uniref:Protein phosphatase n=1 Tax=Silvibacterium bohemicum TaxID=1577686 RepID=A0A841JW98_9BACT|nr:Stp1/IreP family PP2C-type Ser/Thr phosphatase [Silvibacterium bohemicum]MBB6143251.1 protein phosphatase [Silvibacterium bohemicum]
MQTPTKLEAAACSHTGSVRTTNEDSFGYCLDAGAFVVCDGMGGAAAGEIASRLAVDTLIERICDTERDAHTQGVLEAAIEAANRLVYVRSERDTALHGMGTTLVAAVIVGDKAVIAHVGDSRCYLFRHRQLLRQTNDHSLVDEQVRLGQLTQDEADRSPLRNVITRAIGTQKTVAPETSEIDLQPGDLLLLCSDGLTRELPDDRITELLNRMLEGGQEDVEALSSGLVEAANQAGGHDNITCIVTRMPADIIR